MEPTSVFKIALKSFFWILLAGSLAYLQLRAPRNTLRGIVDTLMDEMQFNATSSPVPSFIISTNSSQDYDTLAQLKMQTTNNTDTSISVNPSSHNNPRQDHYSICALVVSTTKPKYREFLAAMRDTLGQDHRVRVFNLFNIHDKTEPMQSPAYCTEMNLQSCIHAETNCENANPRYLTSCVGRTLLSQTVADMKLHESCDWVIKLDPDSFIIPSSALHFVKNVDPTKPVLFGTHSGKVIGLENSVFVSLVMPQGNWMVSKETWRRMTIETPCFQSGPTFINSLIHDEAALALCAWWSRGASYVVFWGRFFTSGGTHQEATEKVLKSRTPECIMLIHRFNVSHWRNEYHRLESLNHSSRVCTDEGAVLYQQRNSTTVIRQFYAYDGVHERMPFWNYRENPEEYPTEYSTEEFVLDGRGSFLHRNLSLAKLHAAELLGAAYSAKNSSNSTNST